MMKRKHTRLCASAAIAAALALSSTPLLAQVAETTTTVEPAPVLTIPETPAPQPVQPTVVLPSDVPETTPAPTMTTTSEPATPTTRTERATSPAAPRTPAPRVRAASPAEPAPAATTTEVDTATAATPPAEVAEPVAPLAAAETEAVAQEPADNGNANAVLVGLAAIAAIAAIVLAIWGFVAIGRRKPADRRAAEVIERPVVAPSVPVASPVMPEPVIAERAPVTPTPIHASAPSMAHSGAAVPLPRAMPATFEERNALIDRMVAAKPDRANPFTSPIQRRKRAKLILQSLGRDFGGREPWIDFSQYPQNWPELAGRNTAAA